MVNLVIFGVGKCSDRVENVLIKNKVCIVAYLDNNIEKQGTIRNEVEILAPKELNNIVYDYIIVSTRNYQNVFEQLLTYNIPKEKIIGYYEDNSSNIKKLKEFIDIGKWNSVVIKDKIDAEVDNIKKNINIRIDNLEYEIAEKLKDNKYFFPVFYSINTTIEKIIKDNCSLCRFGDGEFELMENRKRPKFQDVDSKLSIRLKEVLESKEDNILIAIADNYGSLEKYNDDAADAIRSYMTKEVRESHYKFLDKERIYHNAYLTRPYILYKNREKAGKKFDDIKKIWNNRDITIIEGEYTRMGIGNNLFSNVKSINRILAPSKNAFSVYDKIINSALYIDKNRLILLSLGPTATVLAYDLAKFGYQAIDIGHLDNEYEWYQAKADKRTSLPYKYVNEVNGGENVSEFESIEYQSQIIALINNN